MRVDPPPIGETERLFLEARPVEAGRLAPLSLEFSNAPALQVDLLAYAQPLEALGLAPGRVPRPSGAGDPRPLPPTDELYALQGEGNERRWRVAEGLDPEVANLRIPTADPVACLSRGGCPTADPSRPCQVTCSAPSLPAPPEPPTPPADPIFLGRGCGADDPRPLGQRSLGACETAIAAAACGVAAIQPPEQARCVDVGDPCPDRFAPSPTGADVLHVDDDAAPGGDGTVQAPFQDLATAIARSVPGGVVLIARGRYSTPPTLDRDLTLIGACPADTVLEAQGGPGLTITARAEIQGLRVEGGQPGILVSAPQAEATLRGVVLSGGALGVEVNAGRLVAEAILIRGTTQAGLSVSGPGRAELRGAYLEGASGPGLRVLDGGAVVATHLVLRHPPAGVAAGLGLVVQARATALVREGLLELAEGTGLLATGASTAVTLSDVLVRIPPGQYAGGVRAEEAAHLVAQRLRVEGAQHGGVTAIGASVEVDDLVVGGTGYDRERPPSPLVSVGPGASFVLHRGRLTDTAASAYFVEFGDAEFTDLEMADVARAFDAPLAVSSGTLRGARLHLRRAGGGLLTRGVGADARLYDLDFGELAGTGLDLIGRGDRLVAERVRIGPTTASAVVATGGTEIELHQLHAFETAGVFGSRAGAVVLKDEAGALIEDFVLEDHQVAGLDLASSPSASRPKRLARGLVRRCRFGFVWRADLAMIPTILEGVVFAENEVLQGTTE